MCLNDLGLSNHYQLILVVIPKLLHQYSHCIKFNRIEHVCTRRISQEQGLDIQEANAYIKVVDGEFVACDLIQNLFKISTNLKQNFNFLLQLFHMKW